MLLKKPCKPRDQDEVMIQAKFDKFIRSWSIRYSLAVATSCTSVTIRSVFNMTQGQLPCRAWLPYDIKASPTFWIISIQQIMAVIFASVTNIGMETLVFGLILQTCAQFEIFESRLCKLVADKTTKCLEYSSDVPSKKRLTISEYIRHHLIIYKYAKTVNYIFNEVLFLQFFSSILVLCSTVFYLSAHAMESESVTLIVYTMCMFSQIYMYCWSGNEVILKSNNMGNAVYHTNWPLLSISEKKDLLIIIICSKIPLKFTSSFLITLSLESYSNILKTSYSVFNLLQS
ncbi:odorant receptor 10-like [Anoplolepis gracilipes]|uniref:odorant receptor 10-like n=1 Tax=Anoplolepis gracilipes TaxID=354296 RepID=UPI003BA23A3B